MKSGLVPMHMWLPDAYGRAPASVTLALIGTTFASLYGVLRVCFTLYGKKLVTGNPLKTIGQLEIHLNILLAIFLVTLAIVTIIVGVLMALKQTDLMLLLQR
jgi:multicomponent Na+:H+ antiporter subunit D